MRDYSRDKESRKLIANKHNKKMLSEYSDEIKDSINNSRIYRNAVEVDNIKLGHPKVNVVRNDTVSEIFNHLDDKVCILNFASYRHPGGGFLNGSFAQEESLCNASFLYNVLSSFDSFYKKNNMMYNNSLYTNACIFSENVRFFFMDKSKPVSVITCAAPNNSLKSSNKDRNSDALNSRIKFISDIVNNELINGLSIDTLILGAFGCGVFRQDPIEVAGLFNSYFINK